METEFTLIDSGHITGAHYDSFARKATIRFKNGAHYVVHGISPAAYKEFLEAPSQGEHYHAHIKNDYYVERVK